MTDKIDATDTQEAFLGELRFGRRLTRLSQVMRVGVLLIVGLALLFGGPLEARLGSQTLMAGLISLAAVALSLLSVMELLGGSTERGGSYGLVFETLGGLPSFLTGWSSLATTATVVAALMSTVGMVVVNVLHLRWSSLWVAFVILAASVIARLFTSGGQRRLRNLLLLVAAFGLLVLVGMAAAVYIRSAAPLPGRANPSDLWREAARFALAFLAAEAILSARRSVAMDLGRLGRTILATAFIGMSVVVLPLLAAQILAAPETAGPFAIAILSVSPVGSLISGIVVALTMMLSAQALMTVQARGLYDMSRRGALPQWMLQIRRPFTVPPSLVLLAGALIAPLIGLAGTLPLLDIAAFFVLVTIGFLNVAAIYSRRSEPERRRTVLLPLYPLIPAVSLVAVISLLVNLHPRALLLSLGWSGVGILVYAFYARRRQAAAQEGVVLFGSDRRPGKDPGTYRILVPLAAGEQRNALLELAVALGKELKGEVLPLQVIPVADPMAMEEGRRIARERNTLFRWSTRLASRAGVISYPITRLARTVAEGIVDTASEEECDLLLLPWAIVEGDTSASMGSVLDPVIMQSPCDTAVMAYRHSAQQEPAGEIERGKGLAIESILVPTAGGPHAPLAIGLALVLARHYGSKVRAVYVAGLSASQAEVLEGEQRIQDTFTMMKEKAASALRQDEDSDLMQGIEIESKVIRAGDVVEGIALASQEADLAFIGASEESMIDQVLFGNLPRQVASECKTPVIMVRRYRGLPRFWLRRILESIFQALPTLDAEDQIDLYKRVRRGARPDVDFFVMMGLSATIASLGLLLNSGAVIIGAMLVAPLFTPILAFSMAITLGDIRLVRLAVESSLKGVFLAIGLALAIGTIAPLPIDPLTLPEIASRTQPNLLDLAVALAAGAAGAYAIARKDVAAALPGVAIAAALVPPLSVVGISLSAGRFASAGGAVLLVTTNLIAISLAGSITLLLLGFRPGERGQRQANLRTGLAASVVLLLVISIPLASVLLRTARRTALEQAITSTLRQEIAEVDGVELDQVEIGEGTEVVRVTATVHVLDGPTQLSPETFARAIQERIGREIELRLIPIEVIEAKASSELSNP
jgi:uncharacterized hydrophobic protein (TIGR00271 family)